MRSSHELVACLFGGQIVTLTVWLAPQPIAVEQATFGQSGVCRWRTDDRVRTYLLTKRPHDDEHGRIISYRGETRLGYNLAVSCNADGDVLVVLRAEYEWAVARLRTIAPEALDQLSGGEF